MVNEGTRVRCDYARRAWLAHTGFLDFASIRCEKVSSRSRAGDRYTLGLGIPANLTSVGDNPGEMGDALPTMNLGAPLETPVLPARSLRPLSFQQPGRFVQSKAPQRRTLMK